MRNGQQTRRRHTVSSRFWPGKFALGLGGFLVLLQSARAEWTLTGYLGGAHTAPTSLRLQSPQLLTDLRLEPVSYQTKPFESPLYYGYRVGHFFSRSVGLEGEFTHLKAYAETDQTAHIAGTLQGIPIDNRSALNSVVQRFNISHGVNLLMANVAIRKAFGETGSRPRLVVSGRVGGGITIPHPENEVLGASNREHYEVGAPVWQLGAGLELHLWGPLYADGEVKFTRTRQKVDFAQGTAESLLSTAHALVGVVWHF